jgi:hypothetical protein
MADAKDDKTQAAGPDDVKKATASAAAKADDSKKAAAKADDKAREAVTDPKKNAADKPAKKTDEAKADQQAKSNAPETKENREANAAPAPVGPQPEFVLDERNNRRPGPGENPDNKAFPTEADGAHQAPLEKTSAEAKRQTRPAEPLSLTLRNPHAALQEDRQWILNREGAKMATSSDTPAGDSSPAPEGADSANWVDTPARAHTLSELDDRNTADSVGQRLRRAEESARLEERPDRRGIHSDSLPGAYTVEDELRVQWPGISLGDDVIPEETNPDKD